MFENPDIFGYKSIVGLIYYRDINTFGAGILGKLKNETDKYASYKDAMTGISFDDNEIFEMLYKRLIPFAKIEAMVAKGFTKKQIHSLIDYVSLPSDIFESMCDSFKQKIDGLEGSADDIAKSFIDADFTSLPAGVARKIYIKICMKKSREVWKINGQNLVWIVGQVILVMLV